MLARPLIHNAALPSGGFSSLSLSGDFATPTFVGATYDDSLIINGGSGTFGNQRVVSGALPGGLSLSVVSPELKLTGTPTTAGTFNFIAAVDDTVNGWTTFIEATIVVYEALAITGTYTNIGGEGVPYSSDLTISGGDGVYSNPVIDNPISGLEASIVNGNILRLSGIPDTPDHYEFLMHCDSGDGQSATSSPQVIDIS